MPSSSTSVCVERCGPEDMFGAHCAGSLQGPRPRVVKGELGAEHGAQPDPGQRRHFLNTVTNKSRKHFNIDASRYDEMQAGSIALTKLPDMDAE